MSEHDLSLIVPQFDLLGDFVCAERYGNGHINDTYAVTMDQGGTPMRYLFQRINGNVFKNVPALMQNVERVCAHLQKRLTALGAADASRRALTLIRTRGNLPCHVDADGNTWRAYIFVEGATGHEVIQSARQAYEVARAFGEFQRLLVDLPGEPLNETIPNFHNTPVRFAAFEKALAEDVRGRAASVRAEIDFVLARRDLASALTDKLTAGELPLRATHNDTKLNNVLIDNATSEALCVIDFDTLMPGLSLYDFGDLVRTSTSPAPEDEMDLPKVTMQMHMFEALVQGFLASAGSALTSAEIECLPLGGKVITFECGVRFLTDYLQGDTYFRIKREHHNLDRCRTQFKLVESMEQQAEAMATCVKEAACAC